MTERKIVYALNRINSCKEKGFLLEALLKNYHLNLNIIRYILGTCSESYSPRGKKIKEVFHQFLEETSTNPKLRSVLNKRNLKIVKPWLQKMDLFFKTLKMQQPSNVRILQQETEKITGLLNISFVKLSSQNN